MIKTPSEKSDGNFQKLYNSLGNRILLVVNGQFKAKFEKELVKNTHLDGQSDRDVIVGGGVVVVTSDKKTRIRLWWTGRVRSTEKTI